MLQPLLIEIGVEELPAVPLLKELPNIEKKWAEILEEHALMGDFEFYYTPRRLVLWHTAFKTRQDDAEEELFGAPVSVAFTENGPTPAAEGFARKCGVEMDAIGRAEKGGKEVLYFKRLIPGKPSEEMLPAMLDKWLKSLNFGKSMRWGSLQESFIRPIRWVNVMLGERPLELELFGVAASSVTYVHRMSDFDAKRVGDSKGYFETLKEGSVALFPDERRRMILGDFAALEIKEGIEIEVDEDLLDEVVAITEHPTVLMGAFDESFLRLPPEVIITSMKEHQRYFPVFKEGRLMNRFVVVSNALTEDFSKVIEGNERVLRPRLADALFFYDNDLKRGLKTEGLEKVVYMDGLGSVADKIARECAVAEALFERYAATVCAANGKDEAANRALLMRSMTLAKADLMSEMVYEFTELQGIMGYYYATQLGEDAEVALAIKEQYLPDGEESALPSTPIAAITALAIKLDTLLGMFSIDEIPTGSRDPFGLRRAVNGIVRIVRAHRLPFDLNETVRALGAAYSGIDYAKLETFMLERIYQFYKVNPSVIKAVLASGERELLALDAKIAAVDTIVQGDSFATVFSTFKRVANITKDVDLQTLSPVEASLFEHEAERTLHEAFVAAVQDTYEGYVEQLDALFALRPQLDAFFDNVMVNAEDEAVRNNRKALVATIYKALLSVADIKEISV